MKTVKGKPVFTDGEKEVIKVRDAIAAEGMSVPLAAKYALTATTERSKPFVEHISEGKYTVKNGKVVDAA